MTGSNIWICTGRGAADEFFGDFVFGAFVQREDFAGALDHAHRQRGEARDFDAVAAVGGAGLDSAQEEDLIAGLFDRHVEIAHAVELLGELGQLVIVGGEEGLGAACVSWMCSITAQASARPS